MCCQWRSPIMRRKFRVFRLNPMRRNGWLFHQNTIVRISRSVCSRRFGGSVSPGCMVRSASFIAAQWVQWMLGLAKEKTCNCPICQSVRRRQRRGTLSAKANFLPEPCAHPIASTGDSHSRFLFLRHGHELGRFRQVYPCLTSLER